jgi:SPFH domain / Band 7 family
MRHISLFLVLIVSVLATACDNEIIDNSADFEFETIDKEANKLNLTVTIRYRLKSRLEKKIEGKYGRHYKDSVLLPAISSVSEKVLKDYSAGEIYNYRRDEIEQRLGEQTKTTYAESDIELTDFLIRSVKLSDTVMHKFEKEHATRFQKAMNNCIRDVKAVVTDMRSGDPIVFYEFIIENKNYKGVLNIDAIGSKVNLGDSVSIEYACEDPIFHRVKK